MSALVQAPWLGVAVPFVLALLLGIFGRFARPIVPWVAMLGPAAVIAIGAGSLGVIPPGASERVEPWTSTLASAGSVEWLRVGRFALTLTWAIDSLAAAMLLVVGVVALMVMLFSVGYMEGERGWPRYFALLSLFTGSMTLLVIGGSFTSLFFGWELVGACSYLLIGFWFARPSAAAAAVKAFLTTRVGDIGLLIGLAILWASTNSLSYTVICAKLPSLAPTVVAAAAVGIAIGAIGKSAQFPLHIWLPDAMEGPTPVSALIHAATMVAAGVFLVARMWPVFAAAPSAQTLILVAGVVSALGGALAAIAQRDIKRVLAYSTISQLGFMFAALGVGAWAVAFFHLVTHAAFKALLFLTSGSVIHGSGTQDMREMGGLRRQMPVTTVAWIIGVGALVGIPPLAGFFSKDLIFDVVWRAQPAAAVALFVAAVATGFYCGRSTRLAFFGERRGEGQAHESPLSMLVPLGVLAAITLVAGFLGTWLFVRLSEHPESLALPISVVAVTLGLAGAVVGWVLEKGVDADEALEARLGIAWKASDRAFGFDGLVTSVIVKPASALARIVWGVIDRYFIDGTVEGSAFVARWLGGVVTSWQSGDAQWYGAAIVFGVLAMLAASIWVGR